MNNIRVQALSLLAFFLTLQSCGLLLPGSGGGGGFSIIRKKSSHTPTAPINYTSDPAPEAQLSAEETSLDSSSLRLPYLGTWTGEEYVELEVAGIPMLRGTFNLTVTFSEGNHAVARTDAVHSIGFLEKAMLRTYLATLRNIDFSMTDVDQGQVATTGAIWEESEGKNNYAFTLAVEEQPEAYQVRFRGRDVLIFYWKDSEGVHETVLKRI